MALPCTAGRLKPRTVESTIYSGTPEPLSAPHLRRLSRPTLRAPITPKAAPQVLSQSLSILIFDQDMDLTRPKTPKAGECRPSDQDVWQQPNVAGP
ncbi:MAG: hypothetical protein GX826_11990 [Gammaproteobacteria bacterium]|nr:hypothetical protein [Gammaproteobacteria bacterium]